MAPSPGVEPGRASFGGSTLIPSGRRCAGLLARNRTWTTGFVDRCVVPPRRGEREAERRRRGGRKRSRTPHPFRGALCFRGKPGSQPVFLPYAPRRGLVREVAWWSVRESNPLREVLQTSALPIELTDHGGRQRSRTSRRCFRANRVPGDLRPWRICLPCFVFDRRVVRTAGFEPALSSPPDWRFCRAKLRPEMPGHTRLCMPRRGRRGRDRGLHEGGPRE